MSSLTLALPLLFSEVVGTVVGHFAGLAASILIGDWLVSFITSQAVSFLVGKTLALLL